MGNKGEYLRNQAGPAGTKRPENGPQETIKDQIPTRNYRAPAEKLHRMASEAKRLPRRKARKPRSREQRSGSQPEAGGCGTSPAGSRAPAPQARRKPRTARAVLGEAATPESTDRNAPQTEAQNGTVNPVIARRKYRHVWRPKAATARARESHEREKADLETRGRQEAPAWQPQKTGRGATLESAAAAAPPTGRNTANRLHRTLALCHERSPPPLPSPAIRWRETDLQ